MSAPLSRRVWEGLRLFPLLVLLGCQTALPLPEQALPTTVPLISPPPLPGEATAPPDPVAPAGSPGATAAPSVTPTSTLTPTPTPLVLVAPAVGLPEMRLYSDPDGVASLRVPRAWEGSEQRSAEGLIASFQGQEAGLIVLSVGSGALAAGALEPYVASIVGEEVEYEQEALADGTLRLTGVARGAIPFELRVGQLGGLLWSLLASAPSEQWEMLRPAFDATFESFHLYPALAARAYGLPPPAPGAGDLTVRATHPYTSDPTTLWVVGEVENRGAVDVELPSVRVQLLSGDGRVVTETVAYAEADLLRAGERSPFVALFSDLDPALSWTGIGAEPQADSGGALTAHALLHRGLRVEQAEGAPLSDGYRVTGSIRNEGDTPAAFVEVTGGLYNPQGELVAVASTFPLPFEALAPHTSAPFELRFDRTSGTLSEVAGGRVWVEGRRAEGEPVTLTPSATP